MLLGIILFLFGSLGHVAIYSYGINRMYGSRHRGWWVTALRLAAKTAIVTLPPLFILLYYPIVLGWTSWRELPAWVLIYVALCLANGLIVMPFVTVRRWLRKSPAQQTAESHTPFDVAAHLGYKPVGFGKRKWLARFPCNDIYQVEFTNRTFVLDRLPVAWDGLTLLHLSDFHLCGIPDKVFFQEVFQRCMATTPDFVILTGDVVDSDEHYEWIAETMKCLHWREGAFAVLGNHDAQHNVQRVQRELEALGFQMLGGRWVKHHLSGHELVLIGNELPWLQAPPDLKDCPREAFRLGVAHAPDVIPWARAARIDLLLAGHNHGGQIRFPLIGPMLCPSRYSRRYDQGVFYESPTLLHVNRGLGGTYPLRYRCRPEVTLLTLRART